MVRIRNWKSELGNERVPQRTWLEMPAIGMEAEFNVFLDDVEINPEPFWKHPSRFIDAKLLPRTKKSSQLPTGGAVYFDRGVIEVVTPLVEIDHGCSARVVRSLWEQIEFVRAQLTRWGEQNGRHVRLKAYSTHYNVSFELRRSEMNRNRNIQKLALLLAYILPIPVMLVAANRRSTGIGVRPRGNRIEITADFTPDPGLMIAASTLIVGIVREVISWPSYQLSILDDLPIPIPAGVKPGKHTTRKGWLTKDFHYAQSPYTCDIDAPLWTTTHGETMSLREMGFLTARFFRQSIRQYTDPFSDRLLFAVLEGRAPSLLELRDRPAAYEDVGRLCRWGRVIHEIRSSATEARLLPIRLDLWNEPTIAEHIATRERERGVEAEKKKSTRPRVDPKTLMATLGNAVPARRAPVAPRALLRRRSGERARQLLPRTASVYLDRRSRAGNGAVPERRGHERRHKLKRLPFPDRRLTRSAYEAVFLKLVSGRRLKIEGESYTPVGMKGWYHAIFRRDTDGSERLMTIDQLVRKMSDWH